MAEETSEEFNRRLNREMALSVKDKSEDDFEKNLIFITSGTLVLSMTFIEKIAPLSDAKGIWWLIVSWSVLTISLLCNLISHQLAAKYPMDYLRLYEEGKTEGDVNKVVNKNNKFISFINNLTVIFMVVGISTLVVYCSINAYQMSKTKQNNPIPDKNVDSSKYQGGRQTPTFTIPPKTIPQPPSTPPDTGKKD